MLKEAKADRKVLHEKMDRVLKLLGETKEFSKAAAKDRQAKDLVDTDLNTLRFPWRTIEEVRDAMADETVRNAFTRWIHTIPKEVAEGHPARTVLERALALPLRQRVFRVYVKG